MLWDVANPRIMLVGADNTSDRFGAALAQKLTEKRPEGVVFGIGGPLMADAGVRLLYDISEMVSLGVFDSLKGAHIVKRLIQRVSETMDEERPHVMVQIGLPLFSLRLLEIARCKGLSTMYYYTPLSRGLVEFKTERFAGLVDKVIGISKFETESCQQAGISAEFVGHPLVDLVRSRRPVEEVRAELNLNPGKPVIAVLPGAREVEVKNVLPTVLRAIGQLRKLKLDCQTVVSVAPTVRKSFVDQLVSKARGIDVVVGGDTGDVLDAADLAITSIGTVSLEAALMGVPCLAVYRVPTTTYLFDKLFANKPRMTVVNNVLEEQVVPEFIQSEFGLGRLVDEIVRLLTDEAARQEMLGKFAALPEQLGEPGSVDRAAEMILAAAAQREE
jgi:lipid-A-disaccharide synthase